MISSLKPSGPGSLFDLPELDARERAYQASSLVVDLHLERHFRLQTMPTASLQPMEDPVSSLRQRPTPVPSPPPTAGSPETAPLLPRSRQADGATENTKGATSKSKSHPLLTFEELPGWMRFVVSRRMHAPLPATLFCPD